MARLGILRILAPSRIAAGYALFVAINAASVWGGVFPFLPTSLAVPAVTYWFFLAQTLALCASFALSAAGSYWLPGTPRAFWVRSAGLPYVAGWLALAATARWPAHAPALAVAGGTLVGMGSAGFALLWQRLLAGRDADAANRDLLSGTAWGVAAYYGLSLLPRAVLAVLVPAVLVPLFAAAIYLNAREVPRDQPMFADRPRDNARVYRRVLHDHWRSALCVGAVGFCAGVMRALSVGDPPVGELVNGLSMAGVLIITLLIAGLWGRGTLSLSIVGGYKVVFPFLITSFLALPLLGGGYGRWLAAALYAVYTGGLLLMTMQCAQTSRDRGVNPAFAYGYFGAIVFSLNGAGFLGGALAGAAVPGPGAPLTAVALVAAWALGLMHFVGSGGFSRALGRPEDPRDIELVALGPVPAGAEAGAGAGESATRAGATAFGDAETCADVAASAASCAEGAGAVEDAPAGEMPPPGEPPAPGSNARLPAPAPAPATPAAAAPPASPAPPTAALVDAGAAALTVPAPPDAAPDEAPAPPDRVAAQVELARARYRLSAREAEVVGLIARGHTVARIAETLIVSENTVRTHAKRIYAKLGIHKKQELVDLLEGLEAE